MPEVCVVEQHHEVLTAWARLRRRLDAPPAVLTLDHHTDVLPAFGRFAEGDEAIRQREIAAFDYRSDESVEAALTRLRHDEHIDLALRGDVIASCRIVAHENFTEPAHPAMSVYVAPDWPDGMTMLNDAAAFRPYADRMLESDFLRRAEFSAPRWILDIDLDCLLTRRAAQPVDADYFCMLWMQSELVTISLERDWVRLLRLPGETIDSDDLLALLQRIVGIVGHGK